MVFVSSRIHCVGLLPSPCNLHSAMEAAPLLELVAQYPETVAFDKRRVARWAECVFSLSDFARPVSRIDIVKSGAQPNLAGAKECVHRRVRRVCHSIVLVKGGDMPRDVR